MDIMAKTYELIEVLDNSSLMKNLDFYKKKILGNNELLELIKRGNEEKDEYILMGIKRELYKYVEYQEYMRLYNELNYLIIEINSRYKALFQERVCRI